MNLNLGATEQDRRKNLHLFKEWVGKDAWKHNRWEARGKVLLQSRTPVLVHRQ